MYVIMYVGKTPKKNSCPFAHSVQLDKGEGVNSIAIFLGIEGGGCLRPPPDTAIYYPPIFFITTWRFCIRHYVLYWIKAREYVKRFYKSFFLKYIFMYIYYISLDRENSDTEKKVVL